MSNDSCNLFEQPSCTACNPATPATPLSEINRPGLSAIAYRVGTFPAFRQAMLDAMVLKPVISVDRTNPNVSNRFTTWAADDYAVAVLECWAYVCDVLTFYQQANANESFLRTAQLPESLARLAYLLGYEPSRGMAASAWLALFADARAMPTLPAGLGLQSIPSPGQNPAIFELSQGQTINSASNQPVLLGDAGTAYFTSYGIVPDDSNGPPIVSGTKLVFMDSIALTMYERIVSSVTPAPLGGKKVNWFGSLGANVPVSSLSVARFGRKFKYFGSNAPVSYTTYDPASNAWNLNQTDFTITAGPVSGQVIPLDGTFDGLAAGGVVWAYYKGTGQGDYVNDTDFVAAFTITNVAQGHATCGPLSGACTLLTLNQILPQDLNDQRGLVLYEIFGDPPSSGTSQLIFSPQQYAASISEGANSLFVVDGSGIKAGTQMILVSGATSDFVTASGAPTQNTDGSWTVPITPQLANGYKVSQTLLYANVAPATQGQTQTEQILGDGDASQEWQEFKVPISPVTYVADAASDSGASSTLAVFVDEMQWMEVPTFYGHGPDETIFITRVDATGNMFVRFGDGITGRRVTTGQRNITAQLRKGLGKSGNVPAGSISVILQPQPGLKAVINPLAAIQGEDAEDASTTRQNAPTSVITLGRAVSLRDYEVLALSYSGVAKAKASWGDFNCRRGVYSTVAASGGGPLDPLVQPLRQFLDAHRDPNVPLKIMDYTSVPFVFSATINVLKGNKQSVVKAAVDAAFGPGGNGSGYLAFNQLQFGQSMFPSALISVLQDVAGVGWVELQSFYELPPSTGHGFGTAPVQDAIMIGAQEIAQPTQPGAAAGSTSVALSYAGGINDLTNS